MYLCIWHRYIYYLCACKVLNFYSCGHCSCCRLYNIICFEFPICFSIMGVGKSDVVCAPDRFIYVSRWRFLYTSLPRYWYVSGNLINMLWNRRGQRIMLAFLNNGERRSRHRPSIHVLCGPRRRFAGRFVEFAWKKFDRLCLCYTVFGLNGNGREVLAQCKCDENNAYRSSCLSFVWRVHIKTV